MSFVKFPRARYTKPGAGKIFLFLLDQCNDFQIQLFARMNSSISLLGERWDSLGWQTFSMVEMLPIIKSQHCCKQSHCQVSRLTLTMILTAFCSRHFAPPRPVKITKTCGAQRDKVDFHPLKFGRQLQGRIQFCPINICFTHKSVYLRTFLPRPAPWPKSSAPRIPGICPESIASESYFF